MRRLAVLLVAAGSGVAAVAQPAAAQQFPAKPVRIVVPSSPGGASDLVARLAAASLAERLGQAFVVENRVASGGIVATQQVADSPPDGYTLLATFDTFATNPFLYRQLKWDPVRDFAPVIELCRYPQVLLVHPSLGVHTVKDFVALAKAKGGELNYGSAGPASSSRLAYELFKETAGIDTVPVHYKGGGPAIQDLLAGNVQVMLVQGGGAIAQYVRSGRLLALGVSSPERSRFYPDVPTIAETYPGFESESWVAFFAPAATPDAILDKLHDTLADSLKDRDLRARFESQGCELAGGTRQALAERVRSDQEKWRRLIRERNITLQ
jgi:tripartite-type tricarboxylate transporter receptor subunit TctC